jgi:hypothetical protein
MEITTLKNGIRRVVASVPQTDNPAENTVSVLMQGGLSPWVLHFWGRFGTHRAYLGAVRTFASRFERVVAVVSFPGARAIEVEGQSSDQAATDEVSVHFEGVPAYGGPWGVQPVRGQSVEGARSYRTAQGTNGVVTITGEVFGWAAESAAGGTVTVTAGPALSFGPVAVPAGIPIAGDCRGLLAPVSTWTFVGTDHYFIEYMPPGGQFDG